MPRYVYRALVLATLAVIVLSPQAKVFADTLFVSPTSGSYSVGQIFSTRVLVSSPSRAVNAISGTISFSRDKMQVVSVSKAGSILSLWVEEPSFSSSVGTVNFEGVVPNPGYIGSSGTIITVNFRVTAPGDANVRVSSGSILANDGLGTNVLRTLGTSSFTFSPATPAPVPTSVVEEPADLVEEPVYVPEPQPQPQPEPVKVVINEGFYDKAIKFFSTLSGSLLGLLLIVLALITLLMYGRSRFVRLRRGVRKETYDVERVLHRSFDTIKEDITASVGLLERAKNRRHLTEEERAVVSLLKQHLRQTEKLVDRELGDIRHHTEN